MDKVQPPKIDDLTKLITTTAGAIPEDEEKVKALKDAADKLARDRAVLEKAQAMQASINAKFKEMDGRQDVVIKGLEQLTKDAKATLADLSKEATDALIKKYADALKDTKIPGPKKDGSDDKTLAELTTAKEAAATAAATAATALSTAKAAEASTRLEIERQETNSATLLANLDSWLSAAQQGVAAAGKLLKKKAFADAWVTWRKADELVKKLAAQNPQEILNSLGAAYVALGTQTKAVSDAEAALKSATSALEEATTQLKNGEETILKALQGIKA